MSSSLSTVVSPDTGGFNMVAFAARSGRSPSPFWDFASEEDQAMEDAAPVQHAEDSMELIKNEHKDQHQEDLKHCQPTASKRPAPSSTEDDKENVPPPPKKANCAAAPAPDPGQVRKSARLKKIELRR